MTPERYRQIGEIYHSALEIDAKERAAFLEQACRGDDALRQEVESLIESHEQAPEFIAAPALAVAAEELAKGQADSLTGQTIGRYKIISLLGEGGMGRVYLADDTELGRQVAVKFLPEYFTNDKNQVQRFRQEARAASALNHPNILTVYEVGQVAGTEFIATEYVEGVTLRAMLTRTAFSVREALDVAAQIADALVAAHHVGIVHRDIKPENVMIRRDSYVKVLDFGLAKLTENLSELRSSEGEAATRPGIKTNPGVVMGTAEYMSPEQARGIAVDGRTDVWSLGVVLYEMIAGRRPFSGETHGDAIVAILEREPVALLHLASKVPEELDRIVTKALTKNADERYQTVKDMGIDLRRLKRRLDVEAEIERSASAEASVEPEATRSKPVMAERQADKRTGRAATAATTSGLEFAVTEVRRHKVGFALAGVLIIVVLAVGGYGLYHLLSHNQAQTVAPFEAMTINPLTSDGTARTAAISPDSRYVVYVLRNAGQETIRVRQVTTSSDLLIVPSIEGVCLGLTFSPDGDYVYYVTVPEHSSLAGATLEVASLGALYQVPVLGGASRKLLTDVGSPITFSPDGKRFAFVRTFLDGGETALMVANADGGGERKLAARTPPDVFVTNSRVGDGPAWSPDGQTIACSVGRFARQRVMAVSAIDGTEVQVGSGNWQSVGRLSWFPDGSGLVMVAMDQRLVSQLWQLSYPKGEIRRITNDLNFYTGVSMDAEARTLVTVQMDPRTQHLWVVGEGQDSRSAKKIVSTKWKGEGPSWTPDGRIVYPAIASDKWNLWIANADGTNQKQLTTFTNPINVRPSVSPDGRYIVFVSDQAGPRNIWRVDIDGSNPVQLTTGVIDTWPTCSPDSRWVIYVSERAGKVSLLKVSIDGGDPVELLMDAFATAATISPDGKLIASLKISVGSPVRVVLTPFEGGTPVKTIDLPSGANMDVPVRWTPDGRALTYVEIHKDVGNIWSQPLEGRAPRQVTNFNSDQIVTFDWSRDGKQLALWRFTTTRNVVLMNDFK